MGCQVSEVQILSPRPWFLASTLGQHLKILVTNDDGIQSKGILVLAKALAAVGEVFVVAPDREKSAVAHSLTLHRPLRVERIKKNVFAVDGTPADCVHLAVNAILPEKPDLLVSGINKGENVGNDISYSGTVSAAFEGTLLRIPAFSISLASRSHFQFQGAARFAVKIARHILKKGLPKDTFLNINIPNVPEKELKGFRITHQGRVIHGNAVVEKVDPRGKKYYWIGGGQRVFDRRSDTDFEALSDGCISITPLHIDLTDYGAVGKLKKWKL
jgi:5'-nucleotidase